MVMVLVLVSIVTGLSLFGADVNAAGLSPRQRQILRNWKLRNEDDGRLRAVWNPVDVLDEQSSSQEPRVLRLSKLLNSHGVLKAGYGSMMQAAPSPPASPPAPPMVYIIRAPAPSMPEPEKPSQQSMPHQQQQSSYPPPPKPMPSYPPAPKPQPMPTMMKYPPPQASKPQPMMSYPPMMNGASKPHGSPMPQPMMSQAQPSTSYRVIYIQPPAKPQTPPAPPMKPPRPAPPPAHPPPMMGGYGSQSSDPKPMMMMSYPMPTNGASKPHGSAMMMAMPPAAMAVQSSYSISQVQPGMSYRVIYIQPPEEPVAPPKKPEAPAKPSGYPPPPPQMSYPSHMPAPEPPKPPSPPAAAAEPEKLFIVLSSPSAKSAESSLPACSPAPADFCDSKYAGHYADPSDDTCYIVCNDFGRAFSQRCANGTKWKRDNQPDKPSAYNRCA